MHLRVSTESDVESVAPKLANRSQPALDANVRRAVDETPAAESWQVHETANFRIFHRDARLGRGGGRSGRVRSRDPGEAVVQSGRTAHLDASVRDLSLPRRARCWLRQPVSPTHRRVFPRWRLTATASLRRKIHLRADHAQMRDAILPHEVTHVVVADLFIPEPLPRWADEGIAVLAEPPTEQQLKAAELREPLESGRVFPLDKLMAMDYPDAKDWSLYYAQSVSLTRFLVEQGPPEQFVRFVRASQQARCRGRTP